MTRRLHLPVCVALLSLLSAGGAPAQPLYPRGDATCSGGLSAADLVATVGGLGGTSACGNDDCDRDGAVTPVDLACAAGCLFDACPVPAHAARVDAVVAASAPEAVAASVVRITAGNLGPPDAARRVTVGGREAEVVDSDEDGLLVVLPADLPTGAAEVVVFNGDLAGAPFTLDLAPAVPVGVPDTFDGMLALVDALVERLLGLDIAAAYGAAAPLVSQELGRYRGELAAQRSALATEATVSEAERIRLDAAIDASGAPEMLRQAIADIDALPRPGGEGSIAATVATPLTAFKRGATTIKIVRGVVAATGVTISTPIIVTIAAGTALVGGILLAASDPLTPLIFDATYHDAEGEERVYPTAGGSVTIRGARFDSVTTTLFIRASGGAFSGTDVTAGGETISYRIPNREGVCGRTTLNLVRGANVFSNDILTKVQPELLALPASARFGEQIAPELRGTFGCSGDARFQGLTEKTAGFSFSAPQTVRVPRVLPGRYGVSVAIQGVSNRPTENRNIDVGNPLTGLRLTCPTRIEVPETGSTDPAGYCEIVPLPESLGGVPADTTYTWTSSRKSAATIVAQTKEGRGALRARDIGVTTISATLSADFGPSPLLATSNQVEVAVVDNHAPHLSIASAGPTVVQPGGTITVTATASDNTKLALIKLTALGDAVASGASQETAECLGKKTCTATFTVGVKERDFTQSTIRILADATDAGGNTNGANALTFTVATDDRCPTLTLQSPADGSTVNAGATVTVEAQAHDDQPGDTGVKAFVYSATGPALVAPVSFTLDFPTPQQAPILRFPITVKPADELSEVEDRTIRVSVEARDAAMPPNSCGAQAVSVSVIGVLDACNGGIQVDRPAGYIGESFTITVALADAETVTRVTSVNPGGQFDLQPQGGGVYTVTLFYQGTGSFSLRFVAFDAESNELCSGSIGLESLGPRPEAGVAARQRGGEPAGASLR